MSEISFKCFFTKKPPKRTEKPKESSRLQFESPVTDEGWMRGLTALMHFLISTSSASFESLCSGPPLSATV